jgi:hypothetical protein
MPDIKTALTQALKEWEPEQESNTEDKQMQTTKKTGKSVFTIKNNVSRKSYEYVVANPGVKPKDITEWAKKNGFNPDSAYAIAAHSVRMGTMKRDANGGFIALLREYTPIKNTKKKKNVTGVIPSAPKAPQTTKPAKPTKPTQPVLTEPEAVATLKLTAKYVVDNIGIGEAKALYTALKQIFGA